MHPGGPFWAKKDLGAWSIPKGEHDADEEALACALREFEEETGTTPDAGELDDLGTVRQKSGKVVAGVGARGRSRRRCGPLEHVHDAVAAALRAHAEFPEVDRAAWFSLDEARERINPAQAAFLDRLRGAVRVMTPTSRV